MRVSMLKIYFFLGKMVLSLPGGRNWCQKGHARKKRKRSCTPAEADHSGDEAY